MTDMPGISGKEKEPSALDSILKNCAEKKGHCRLVIGDEAYILKMIKYDAEKKTITGSPLAERFTGKGVITDYCGVFEHCLLANLYRPIIAEEMKEEDVKAHINNSPVALYHGRIIEAPNEFNMVCGRTTELPDKIRGVCIFASNTEIRIRTEQGVFHRFAYKGRNFTVVNENGDDKRQLKLF